MGDSDERATTRSEMCGEPGHGLDVEMVGGFVEHEEVVVVDEKPRQRSTPSLTAGHRRNPGVETLGVRRRRYPTEQTVQDISHPSVACPLVIGAMADDDLAQRHGGVEVVSLGQEPNGDAAESDHTPGVNGLGTDEHAHESCLATAVAADDSDPRSLGDADSDAGEQSSGAERLADVL
ncbi:unannotated protein [freshwater metagenome]|uniref:Unannotated protein n=1 Tax=freshwater metagenome TaxID=449393 RepID=A0A6J7C5K1_9ZZZZ